MDDNAFLDSVKQICSKDSRFDEAAYFFVMEALDFTARSLEKTTKEGPERHVTGKELLDGVRRYTLQEFGPMALTVLTTWGVRNTTDFGAIVFHLVESGKLRKTEADRPEDFADGYDFQEAFAAPYLPEDGRARSARPARKATRRRRA